MDDFANKLRKAFGTDEPILLEEIKRMFPEMPEATLYRRLRSAVASARLVKPRKGVYYIPTETRFGPSAISNMKILEKKYLSDGNDVYGYVTGPTLENRVGISNQVPGTLEIVTNRESTRSRKIEPCGGYREIILRRPRIPVTAENVETLQLLDLLTYAPVDQLNPSELANLKKFASKTDRRKLIEYAKHYPGKTALRILESEANGVLA
ncbi:hypothetical protein [Rubneribacter sp.]